MLAAVTGAVDPPDFARRRLRGQRVEHREDWGRTDAGAQQNDRFAPRPQREVAARRTHLDHVADPDLRVDVSPGCPMGFPLDADTIAMVAGLARKRIAAHEC